MRKQVFKQVNVVNEGRVFTGDVTISDGRIEKIASSSDTKGAVDEIDGAGKYLIPGVIDDQVHFREPGLTHKADIYSESRAAAAGGITSFMEMPNTIPNALTIDLLEDKYAIAAKNSAVNYSFYMGVSNDNADEALRVNAMKDKICGLKIFMGSSTGNMLVDSPNALEKIFSESELLIATHCEDETIIRRNYERIKKEKPDLEPSDHPRIRDENACYESSLRAIKLAQRYDTRLHILHISTAKELALFGNMVPLREKRITAEVCVHHLHFAADDYDQLGYKIKCNPAIKSPDNRDALWKALLDDRLDVIATDHAPHLLSEKAPPYEHAHAGLPLVQHALPLMLFYQNWRRITLPDIVRKMCHAPADCFRIKERGYVREGYHADLVLIDPMQATKVTADNILYKCGWSPFEGFDFPFSVALTMVNGNIVYENGRVSASQPGQRLAFEHDR